MALFAGKVGGVQYQSGLIRAIPVPEIPLHSLDHLSSLGRRGWAGIYMIDTSTEASHAFLLPALLQVDGRSLQGRLASWSARVASYEDELMRVQSEVDRSCFELYGISNEDRAAILKGFGDSNDVDESVEMDEADSGVAELDRLELAAGVVSWAVGVGVGRFDGGCRRESGSGRRSRTRLIRCRCVPRGC